MFFCNKSRIAWIFYIVMISTAKAEGPSPEFIKAKALAQAKRIHSIRYTSKTKRLEGPLATKSNPKPRKSLTEIDLDYVDAMQKFRAHVKLVPEKEKPLELYSVYDGHRYRSHDVGSGGMMLANEAQMASPIFGAEALVFPYLFLMSENAILTHDLLRDEGTWNRAFADAKYLDTLKSEGFTLHRVRLPGPKPEQSIIAAFAEELDYFPHTLLFEEAGHNTGSVRTIEYARLGDEAEPVIFPTQLQVVLKDLKKGTISEDRILTDRHSIAINQDVPDEIFHIPMEKVKVINDVDRKTSRLVGDPAPPTPQPESWSSIRILTIVTVLCAVGLILAVAIGRRSPRA